MKLANTLMFGLVLLTVTHVTTAQSLSIQSVPLRLPRATALNTYSPLLSFDYAGLQSGQTYTLKVWLLTPGIWVHASTQWNERRFTIDNQNGLNAAGRISLAANMDVYDYSQFDWVLRLYNNVGQEVAFTERYVDATNNRAPTLAPIGNRPGIVGQKLEFLVTASDPEGTPISFSVGNLPAGAQFDASARIFTWTPVIAGKYGNIVFSATDSGEGPLADSEIIEIDVGAAPAIVSQPQDAFVAVGNSATLSVQATSSTAINYRWQFNGTDLPGATSAALQLSNVSTNQAGFYRVVVANSLDLQVSNDALLTVVVPRTARESADLALEHLRRVMDQYHNRIPVYDDISSPGNRFHARGLIPDQTVNVTMNGSWTVNPYSGATCIRCSFTPAGNNFGGGYFLNGILLGPNAPSPLIPNAPAPYFGEAFIAGTNIAVTEPTGINLQGATALTFWAKGEKGGEAVEFFVGGVGRDPATGMPTQPYPDSAARVPAAGTTFLLTTSWQKITIPLGSANLTNIMGGFGWVASAANNPNGVVFYLDDIEFQLSPARLEQKLNEPRFLRSFTTRPVQPNVTDGNADDDLDLVLRNNAFLYDEALALLAFLADGSTDSIRRAKLIGDALVYASKHDRTYTDGR
ncbi:MAG: immunoglobulin domain-containing protein, partial [Opitutaceae bacterium]